MLYLSKIQCGHLVSRHSYGETCVASLEFVSNAMFSSHGCQKHDILFFM